jgi:RimJ/RimL family protein N-acetyltransferase
MNDESNTAHEMDHRTQHVTQREDSSRLRVATSEDLAHIMQLINYSKALLKTDGIPQWQKGTPNEGTVTKDIDNAWEYVLEIDGVTAGCAALWQKPDPNYSAIYDGRWLPGSDTPYAALHRVSVSPDFHGQHLGERLLKALIERGKDLGFRQFRIDTHAKNLRMQHLIAKTGFQRAGVVRMHDDPHDLRYVYQLFV